MVIDPSTGAVSATVGTITGHAEVISLAFDPGATASVLDDRLLALSSDGAFEDLIAVNPSSGAASVVGPLSIGVVGNFQGLAYDSANQKLYASGSAGGSLFEIDISTCFNPTFCATTEVLSISLPRIDSGLAYSRDSGRLYLVGLQTGQIFYDTIDATTLQATTTVGIDGFSIGGLSAIPLPEPAANLVLPSGVALLALLARRRGRLRRGTTAAPTACALARGACRRRGAE